MQTLEEKEETNTRSCQKVVVDRWRRFRRRKRATCDWPRWTGGGGTRSVRSVGVVDKQVTGRKRERRRRSRKKKSLKKKSSQNGVGEKEARVCACVVAYPVVVKWAGPFRFSRRGGDLSISYSFFDSGAKLGPPGVLIKPPSFLSI